MALLEQLFTQQFMWWLDWDGWTEIERQRFVAVGGAADSFHAGIQFALADRQHAAEVVFEDGEVAGRLRIAGCLARRVQRR